MCRRPTQPSGHACLAADGFVRSKTIANMRLCPVCSQEFRQLLADATMPDDELMVSDDDDDNDDDDSTGKEGAGGGGGGGSRALGVRSRAREILLKKLYPMQRSAHGGLSEH